MTEAEKINLTNRARGDTLNLREIYIHKSLSAASNNYPVKLPDSNQHVKFAEGTKISKIKVLMGKGTDTPIRDAVYLENDYNISAGEWQKVRGEGFVRHNGKNRKVELHWYEAEEQRVKMKVKKWLDES